MEIAYFRTLLDYDAWARARLFAAVEQLSGQEYLAPRQLDYGSIHGTLVHAFAPGPLWLSRWHGVSPERMLDARDIAGYAELKRRWRELDAQLAAYLATLDDAALDRVIAYRSTEGLQLQRRLWETLAQIINHGTAHRSELALVVSQLGHSPGDLDLILYLGERDRSD